jgi:hypothetical protein
MAAVVAYKPIEEMDEGEFKAALGDPMWRLSNLYYIKTKTEDEDDDDSEGVVVKFRPNRAQKALLKRLWFKNLILKARQLGFTTLIQILFLDYALWTPNLNIGVLAHTDDAAKKIFKKIKFAYDRLPPAMKQAMPLASCSVREMTFANGSTIQVGTSMRGDTIHYLHVSEYGKICAKFPDRAEEIVTGTFPAVPDTGIIFIESTAEGRDGDFYRKSQRAEALHNAGAQLTNKQFRFHFFPWHEEDGYQADPAGVIISQKEHEYFDALEAQLGKSITPAQRAWWISTRDETFSGQDERMWQEYPSTSKEAFQQSTEGTYYKVQITAARKEKRITTVPYHPGIPVNSFWDIGHGDGCAIWLHQRVGQRDNFIKFIEGWGEPYAYYVRQMQATGWVWGRHFLPHDGAHVRQGEDTNLSPQQMLENLGLRNVEIVPRVSELQHGIQAVRDAFSSYWFDEVNCKEGLAHIELYRKQWNERTAAWSDQPFKDIHTEAADALRQHAQGFKDLGPQKSPSSVRGTRKSWRTA